MTIELSKSVISLFINMATITRLVILIDNLLMVLTFIYQAVLRLNWNFAHSFLQVASQVLSIENICNIRWSCCELGCWKMGIRNLFNTYSY